MTLVGILEEVKLHAPVLDNCGIYLGQVVAAGAEAFTYQAGKWRKLAVLYRVPIEDVASVDLDKSGTVRLKTSCLQTRPYYAGDAN